MVTPMSENECSHEDVEVTVGPYGPECRCVECGHYLDEDGPADDEWIARAYEAQAGPNPRFRA